MAPKAIMPPPISAYRNGCVEWHDSDGLLHSTDDFPSARHGNGTDEWHEHGVLHRDGGEPAVIFKDGTKEYWYHGVKYCPGGKPSTVHANGTKIWTDEVGLIHRDLPFPAIEFPDGSKVWYRHGLQLFDNSNPTEITMAGERVWKNAGGGYHRDGDKPAIITDDNTLEFFKNNAMHREGDEPAFITATGLREWYNHGVRTRNHYRPSRIEPDGSMYWFIKGKAFFDNRNPTRIREDGTYEWRTGKKLHRQLMPAVINVEQCRYEWWVNGVISNPYPGIAGRIVNGNCVWFDDQGRCHRDGDLPAIIKRDGTNIWMQHGTRMRVNGKADYIKPAIALSQTKDKSSATEIQQPIAGPVSRSMEPKSNQVAFSRVHKPKSAIWYMEQFLFNNRPLPQIPPASTA